MKKYKKNALEKFSAAILKATVTKTIMGGYGNEGTTTEGCRGTTEFILGVAYADFETYGDFYSSC